MTPTLHRASGLALAVLLLATLSQAQTITVTTGLVDTVDVPQTATLADLPGPDGVVCLREAFLVSDNMAGIQTIEFRIPPDQWYLRNIYPEFCLIYGRFGISGSDTVIVDASTQTAFTGDTNPEGNEIVVSGVSVGIGGPASELTGFHATDLSIDGAGSLVYGNTGGMYIRSYFNTGTVIRDNEADTISLYGASENVVVRNTTTRIRITGGAPGQPAAHNVIGGPDVADRNFITGWGNVGEHGAPAGTTVELYGTTGTLIQNNYIGTTPDGMSIGNRSSTIGIGVFSENDDLTVADNLIAIQARRGGTGQALGAAVFIEGYDGGTNLHIVNNTIGLDAAGLPLLGAETGIHCNRHSLEFGRDITIERNVIAGHRVSGILCENGPDIDPAFGIRITENSVYGNGEMGIDLTPNTWTFGPTENDPMDADIGANGLQNYPVLQKAKVYGGALLHIVGTLQSERNQSYTVEVFAARACDATGIGQGELYVGTAAVATDAAGNGSFELILPAASVPAGWVLTTTATHDMTGSTSEFSTCAPLTTGTLGRRARELMKNPFPDRRP